MLTYKVPYHLWKKSLASYLSIYAVSVGIYVKNNYVLQLKKEKIFVGIHTTV